MDFMKKWKTLIMGISDCRLKGNGTRQIYGNYVLTWSGVHPGLKATHGVGFIMHPDIAKNVLETNFISERIIKIKMKCGQKSVCPMQ